MKILVVGGAGYIGSHMAKMLSLKGHDVVIFDNLSTGFEKACQYGQFILGDLNNISLLESIFDEHRFDAVMHFAGSSLVGESMVDPSRFYQNNVGNTLNLLDAMLQHQVKHFIFSSTAAIFGNPEYTPIDESHPKQPINPYGKSKLMVEQVLEDYANAYGLSSVSLRYFNACGADPNGEIGECHEPETHLIPIVLQVASGRRDHITIYGNDYTTDDGTCIRDYIHVEDLCTAHDLALQYSLKQTKPQALEFNLGIGNGFSVKQVINTAKNVTGVDSLKVIEGKRREGDPEVLVADASLALSTLGWKPAYTDLSTMIQHAWSWELKLSKKL
ncbi:UDP-glucose 4-epimerase GalE [Thiomicrorhabdus indica]|uniref:UDP-glucose 4-epimerase GalE n=1 Tax=Thiomicrorhabdus indica TaxID=2267253 RepID=UPI002AA8EA1C|nr:UDP-glucose 4-epimerase GalE [Thiomicrorhabdus indica]